MKVAILHFGHHEKLVALTVALTGLSLKLFDAVKPELHAFLFEQNI